ncbi:MAG: leucine-rich repeat domain-containing protein [Ruminococcus sp.]|nr:leucine-rich repeat domain-containing protein [Ruminococcus sp.]
MSFYIDETKNNGYPYIQDIPEMPSVAMKNPYHRYFFILDKNKNNGYPTFEPFDEIPIATMTKPYPYGMMMCMGDDVNDGYPCILELDIYISGAFMNAVNLEYVRIPETVRKIGRYAFANTALQKVKISSECEYYKTSFPENCEIEFYGISLNKHSGQLYDFNKNSLIDIDGARIYVQEE